LESNAKAIYISRIFLLTKRKILKFLRDKITF